MTKQQSKHKTRHAPSTRIDVRWHDHEIKAIDIKRKKKNRSEYIRERVLRD